MPADPAPAAADPASDPAAVDDRPRRPTWPAPGYRAATADADAGRRRPVRAAPAAAPPAPGREPAPWPPRRRPAAPLDPAPASVRSMQPSRYAAGRRPDRRPEPRWPALLDPLVRRLSPEPAPRRPLAPARPRGRRPARPARPVAPRLARHRLARSCGCGGSPSRRRCTSTRSTTPGPATEFLQDWRYGLSHSIYEWTHPHLAKYAMALGIVAWGDDRVNGHERPRRAGPRLRDRAALGRRAAARQAGRRPAVRGDRCVARRDGRVAAHRRHPRLRPGDPPAHRDVRACPGVTNVAVDTSGHQLFAVTARRRRLRRRHVARARSAADRHVRVGARPADPPRLVRDRRSSSSSRRATARSSSRSRRPTTSSRSTRRPAPSLGQVASGRGRGHRVGGQGRGADRRPDRRRRSRGHGQDARRASSAATRKTIQAQLERTRRTRSSWPASIDPTNRAAIDAAIADGRLDGLSFQQLHRGGGGRLGRRRARVAVRRHDHRRRPDHRRRDRPDPDEQPRRAAALRRDGQRRSRSSSCRPTGGRTRRRSSRRRSRCPAR